MEHIHTKIDQPLELRKDILESAIDAADILKCCDRMKQVVEDKDLFLNQAKAKLKELTSAASQLHDSLPPVPEEFAEEKPKGQGSNLKAARYQTYLDEHERLEKDLENIRQRLAKVKAV